MADYLSPKVNLNRVFAADVESRLTNKELQPATVDRFKKPIAELIVGAVEPTYNRVAHFTVNKLVAGRGLPSRGWIRMHPLNPDQAVRDLSESIPNRRIVSPRNGSF